MDCRAAGSRTTPPPVGTGRALSASDGKETPKPAADTARRVPTVGNALARDSPALRAKSINPVNPHTSGSMDCRAAGRTETPYPCRDRACPVRRRRKKTPRPAADTARRVPTVCNMLVVKLFLAGVGSVVAP